MTVDKELLTDLVEWVEWQDTLPFEKQEWYQGTWYLDIDEHREMNGGEDVNFSEFDENGEVVVMHKTGCGTAYCAAGYIAAKSLAAGELDKVTNGSVHRGAFVQDLADFAAEKLGIAERVHRLWNAGNSAADIRREAERLAGGPL